MAQSKPDAGVPAASDSSGERRREVIEERSDAAVDLIADRAYFLQGSSRWIPQVPVQVSLARNHRTRIAASHPHDDVGGLDGIGHERLRELPRDVDPDLRHGLDDGWVDPGRGRASRGADAHTAPSMAFEQSRRHLAPPGVV